MKILIADDEKEIRTVVRLLLENKGYEVIEALDGVAAVEAVRTDRGIDLVIMDIMMPKMSGIAAVEEIRRFSTLPVLFLTARSLERDKEAAYTKGGDDYIVKPFSSAELIRKAEALIRRYTDYGTKKENADPDILHLSGEVELDPVRREVRRRGESIDIRDKEMDVLIYLAKNRGRAIGAPEMYEAVWEAMPLPSSNNTVTVHILNLRRKLEENPSAPRLIRTVWGRGYQID